MDTRNRNSSSRKPEQRNKTRSQKAKDKLKGLKSGNQMRSSIKPESTLKVNLPSSSKKDDSNDFEKLLKPYRVVDQMRDSLSNSNSNTYYQFFEDRPIYNIGYQGN